LRKFSGFFCQNELIVNEVEQLGITQRCIYRVKNGLDINEWQTSLPSQKEAKDFLGISPNYSVIFAAIGRFVKRKRFLSIIEAFSEASHQHGIHKLLLLLHGSDFDQSDGEEKEIREKVSKSEAKIMIISPDVKPQISLAACDTTISLGTREGAPNIILESLASGKPVIASDISGHRVYIDDMYEGVLCPEGGDIIYNLRKAFSIVMDATIRRIMREFCLKKAASFDIATTSNVYLSAFLQHCRY
jgi:glycosyltransferase involved in cell wall biosynthesis